MHRRPKTAPEPTIPPPPRQPATVRKWTPPIFRPAPATTETTATETGPACLTPAGPTPTAEPTAPPSTPPPGYPARNAKPPPGRSARLQTQARNARLEADRQARQTASQDNRTDKTIAPGGERRPHALRTYRSLKVQPHRATSEVLGGAYPFLAEEGLGSAGILIGQDAWSGAAFCYDPGSSTSTACSPTPTSSWPARSAGARSTLAKSLAARCIAFGRRVYVPGDPKGEWTAVAHALGGQVIELGGGRPPGSTPSTKAPARSWVSDGTAWHDRRCGPDRPRRRQDLLAALAEATLGRPLAPGRAHRPRRRPRRRHRPHHRPPILPTVVDSPARPAHPGVPGSTRAQLRARRPPSRPTPSPGSSHGDLAGLFDGPSTARFDPPCPWSASTCPTSPAPTPSSAWS